MGTCRQRTSLPVASRSTSTFVDADEPLPVPHRPRGGCSRWSPRRRRRSWTSKGCAGGGFGHVEADECGAMNRWLAAAPSSEVLFNELGCAVSPERPRETGRPAPGRSTARSATSAGTACARSSRRTSRTAGRRRCCFDETTRTLLCGDLFTPRRGRARPRARRRPDHAGDGGPRTSSGRPASPPSTAPTLRRLGDLAAPHAGAHARPGVRG